VKKKNGDLKITSGISMEQALTTDGGSMIEQKNVTEKKDYETFLFDSTMLEEKISLSGEHGRKIASSAAREMWAITFQLKSENFQF